LNERKNEKVKLLLYVKDSNGAGHRLRDLLEPFEKMVEIKTHQTIDSLAQGLLLPNDTRTIVLLLVSTKKELMELQSIRDLLHDVRIIIVLPDREKETTFRGHSFYPRYMSSVDDNFHDVTAVLGKMLENMKNKQT
jgi:hypothetical protein